MRQPPSRACEGPARPRAAAALNASIKNRQCAPRLGDAWRGSLHGRSSQPTQKSAPRSVADHGERLIVYQHSDLLYWWVVWAYGFFCAALTVAARQAGRRSRTDGRPVLIYPGAWLGISFVVLVLFVLIFTNARARGVKSLVLFLLLVVIGLSVQMIWGWNEILGYLPAAAGEHEPRLLPAVLRRAAGRVAVRHLRHRPRRLLGVRARTRLP